MERQKIIPSMKDASGPLPMIGRSTKSQRDRMVVRIMWVLLIASGIYWMVFD